MKKSILFLLIALIFSSGAFAQYPGVPIFGISANADRTYRSLQLGYQTITDTLGSTIDTIKIIPGLISGSGGAAFHKQYVLNLKDSCYLAISNTSMSYSFSTIDIIIAAPAIGGKVKFGGYSGLASQWVFSGGGSTLSVSPTASHNYIIRFICTGTAWIQLSAAIQD
jgi:hypothetical protein